MTEPSTPSNASVVRTTAAHSCRERPVPPFLVDVFRDGGRTWADRVTVSELKVCLLEIQQTLVIGIQNLALKQERDSVRVLLQMVDAVFCRLAHVGPTVRNRTALYVFLVPVRLELATLAETLRIMVLDEPPSLVELEDQDIIAEFFGRPGFALARSGWQLSGLSERLSDGEIFDGSSAVP